MHPAGLRSRRWLRPGLAGALLLAAVLAGLAATSPSGAARARGGKPAGTHGPRTSPQPPNVVVIMSDDQTSEQLRVMPNVLDEIGRHGVTFDNSFVNFSLCCPSRSTFLTGLYAHNHHVVSNGPPDGGFERFQSLDSSNDLPLWLQSAGYYTGQAGKYLNGYGVNDPALIPPGWNEFNAVDGELTYYDYNLNSNGTVTPYGRSPRDYLDDVITGKALDFIDRRAPTGRPFFLYVAYKAPHGGGPHIGGSRCAVGPEPPPRHYGEFRNEPLPTSPSFNEADVSDKPAQIQALPPLDANAIAKITTRYQCELEALQGVDDGVGRIVNALRRQHALANTLIIYASDNGFFHGQHRVPSGKVRLYEPSIRVPLLMRGPGIPAGVHSGDLAINADLAPTIVDATHATAGRRMDGRSLLDAAASPGTKSGRRLLIETTTYAAVRTQRYIYAEHDSGERELYDLKTDPDQLQNVADTPAYADAQAALAADLAALRHCAGPSCKRRPQLELRLHYQRRFTRRHHPNSPQCAKRPVTARVAGADEASLRMARFSIGGTSVQATAAPFRVKLPAAAISDRHGNDVRATADLADGARLTLDAHFEKAC